MSTICGVKMAVPSTQDSIKKSKPRDLFAELKAIWLVLLLVMVAPIQRTKSGAIKSSWLSWSGLLTLAISFSNWWIVWNVFPLRMKALHDAENFPEEVFSSLFILGLNAHFMIPLTSWPFAKKLAGYLNDWAAFQDHFARVCGRQLEFHLYDSSRIMAILCLLTFPLTTAQFSSISDGPLWHSLAYFPAAVHSMAIACAWHCNCAALGSASVKMAEDFATAITTPVPPAVLIRKYRHLWNHLHRLTVELCHAQSATMLHVNLLLMAMNLIAAFGVLGGVIAGVSASRIFVMVSIAISTHIQILLMSSAGYDCAEKVNVEMRAQLLRLSRCCSLVDDYEVNLFLKDLTTRPAWIRVIGYVDIDRNLYVKIIGVLSRNFLVLLQFAYTGSKAAVKHMDTPRDDFYDFL